MTITNRIKEELLNADIEYQYALDAFKTEYPNGVSFLGDTVSTKAATLYARLEKYTERYNALAMLTTPKYEHSTMEPITAKIIYAYNNAETWEDVEAAKKEYFDLYTIRTA